ncbi:MAG TPA: hypothetical protein VI076_04265 [Actinopolymorphaceae bacterium]
MTGDVLTLIEDDHREIERVLEHLRTRSGRRWLDIPLLTTLLIAHCRAEEAAIGGVAPVRCSFESHLEWAPVTAPADPRFESWLTEVGTVIERHIAELEREVLPGLRRDLGPEVRADLAETFRARRAEAFAALHG